MVTKQIIIEGRVQGVGFRYTTRQLAGKFALSGWVKNLPDGDVELVVEGELVEVDAFLRKLFHDSRLAAYVTGRHEMDIPQLYGCDGFEIAY